VANKHLKFFGVIPSVAVIAGFVVTSLLSIFVLQSGINGSPQSTLSQALAEEIAQQVNIKETQLIEQLGKIASSALATNAITRSIADLSAAELTIAQILPFAESEKFSLIEAVVETADFEDATLITIDGLRADFADGWGLVRASNTEPALTLRFEANSDESLENIKNAFRELLQKVKLNLNFE